MTSDAKAIERRQKFSEHVIRMFGLVGEPTSDAKADAETVLEIETALAKASLDRTARRDPANLDHKMALVEFNRMAPNLYFNEYLQAAKPPKFESLNVAFRSSSSQVSALVETGFLWTVEDVFALEGHTPVGAYAFVRPGE